MKGGHVTGGDQLHFISKVLDCQLIRAFLTPLQEPQKAKYQFPFLQKRCPAGKLQGRHCHVGKSLRIIIAMACKMHADTQGLLMGAPLLQNSLPAELRTMPSLPSGEAPKLLFLLFDFFLLNIRNVWIFFLLLLFYIYRMFCAW